jgi:hypothetical protein
MGHGHLWIALGLLTFGCQRPAPAVPQHRPRVVDTPDQQAQAPTPVLKQPVATLGAGPFPTFATLDDVAAAWQGTWLVEINAGTRKQVWDVHGGAVTILDATGTRKRTFTLLSPCTVELASSGPTGRSADIVPFAFDGATLYIGLGEAGMRKGGSMLACAGRQVFVWKDGVCRAHEADINPPRAWHDQPAKCEVRSEGGHDVLDVRDPKQPEVVHSLRTYGTALMSEQMRAHPSTRVVSLEAGRVLLGAGR